MMEVSCVGKQASISQLHVRKGNCLNHLTFKRLLPPIKSTNTNNNSPPHEKNQKASRVIIKVLHKCVISLMAAVAASSSLQITNIPVFACEIAPIFSDLAILISGPPIKDPNALLRYALPIDNKPIKEVQKSLENITENMQLPGVKALDPSLRNVRQAARILNQCKSAILASVADSKKEQGEELLDKLTIGLQDFERIIEDKNRDGIALKQRELLFIVGGIEEAMVDKFPFEIPEEYASKPWLKGRATLEMKVKVKDNPNFDAIVFQMIVDGYNAPITAGNFVDLVERHFYDGMEIQKADGFVVQTGDPDGPAEGFVDPSTEKIRTIPLEIMVEGEKAPIYGATLEEQGLYKAQTKLPFNAFGTLAMARKEFDNNSASSQVFWLLKESELTRSNANILDGRYSVFGYVIENQESLADLKVGDVIESIRVVSGLDNLVNPSYKIIT